VEKRDRKDGMMENTRLMETFTASWANSVSSQSTSISRWKQTLAGDCVALKPPIWHKAP